MAARAVPTPAPVGRRAAAREPWSYERAVPVSSLSVSQSAEGSSSEHCGRYTLDEIRSWFPVTRHHAYLFNGNMAPCAAPVRKAIDEVLTTWSEHGDAYHEAGKHAAHRARALFGALIGAPTDSLALVPNTTTGVYLAAQAIAPRPGSNVVVHELSEQGDVYPWLRMQDAGVQVRFARQDNGAVPLAAFAELVDDSTAAINVTHVSMGSGARLDLAGLGRLARAHDAALVVDAAQSAGAVELDVRATPVDFLAAPTYKWLYGQTGGGFLYVSQRWRERTGPPIPGHGSVTDSHAVNLKQINAYPDARRFQSGAIDDVACVAAAAGLTMLEDVGHENVQQRIAALATRLVRGLQALAGHGATLWTPTAEERRAGIVAFDVPRRAALHAALGRAGIHVGDWQEHLRVDPGFYNTSAEIDEVLSAVASHLT